jgi:hypothetical protein
MNIADKQLARQDTDFAINPGNNNETSIKITDEMCELFLDPLPTEDKTKTNITFFVYKEDFIKSACSIISSLPLLDKHGRPVAFSVDFCNDYLSKIYDYFGDENIKPYSAELLYYTSSRNSCIQGFDKNFNIRSYTVESWSTIRFTKKSDGIHMRLTFSKSNDPISNDSEEAHMPYQEIFYGAPGTGKSFSINTRTKKMPKDSVFRTTFHPDSDYSSFVGAYKPTTVDVPKQFTFGDKLRTFTDAEGNPITEQKVVYGFVKQSFLKAYLKAWTNTEQNVALVVEEINRGNCAQIFGDLFQLLDRKKGFSDYPIEADEDLRKNLLAEFKKISKPSEEYIKKVNEMYADHYTNIIEKIWSGDILLLPDNLYIWATMNTSDQSLFPIDSAFKRRWDWKYIKISDAGKLWQIKFEYETISESDDQIIVSYTQDWWSFLKQINRIISNMTSSADKQLGYFFCKADEEGKIDEQTFVGKVIFYLWNDVFKDYGFEDDSLFKYVDQTGKEKDLAYPDFYNEYGEVNTYVLQQFISNVMNWSSEDTSKED